MRRVVLGVALPLALFLGLRVFWGWEAEHRLAKARAEVRAAGVRLNPPTVSVSIWENAALPVIRAIEALDVHPEERSIVYDADSDRYPESDISWTEDHKAQVRAIVGRNGPVFTELEVAADRPSAQWPTSLSGLHDVEAHPAYRAKDLGDFLYDAAILAHEAHDERQALNDIRFILVLSRTFDHDPAQSAHMVAVSLRARAASAVERIEPDIRLSASDGSLAAAETVLALLVDDRPTQVAHALAWEADINTLAIDYEYAPSVGWEWWLRPMFRDYLARAVRGRAAEVPSVRADNWATANALLPVEAQGDYSNLTLLTGLFDRGLNYSAAYSKLHYWALCNSRATALLLGARLYASQHGHLPTNASDLVPGILPKIPADPYSRDHWPLHYRLDADGPTVWSIGENGTDENAVILFTPWGSKRWRYPRSSDASRNQHDIVYGAAWRTARPAAGARGKTPATSQASSDFLPGVPATAPTVPGAK